MKVIIVQYGFFDDDNREYVITRPDTPIPWINYLGCESYFGIISNTAGGYTFYQDARLRRLTRYRYNNVPLDYGGRYIYLRDNNTGEFWAPTWQPIRKDLDKFECRHGLGYTIISSTYNGIKADLQYFIPLGENIEIWKVKVRNNRDSLVNLSIFSSIEFCLWDAQDDITNFQRNLNTGEVEIDEGVIFHKTEYRERRNHFAYFACSKQIIGYDTQRKAFLGSYRGWDNPVVVDNGKSNNSKTTGWTPIGSHHTKVKIESGKEIIIIFILGYHENSPDKKFDPPESQSINKTNVKRIISKYTDVKFVESAFEKLRNYWTSLLGILQVTTPDLHTNRMVNIWNAYQCMVTFNLSRSASFFESGVSRGIGFRDSNQDILGFLHMVPERAKQRLLDLSATQLKNGGAFHQYQPLTKRGNNEIGSNFNDDPLWLIISTAAYLKETGDFTILDEIVEYENLAGTEETLLEHLKKSIKYILDRRGPHGLPLIGRADWNDCLNLNCYSLEPGESFQTTTNREGKTAESIFIAALFVKAARELAEIFHQKNFDNLANYYSKIAEEMKLAIYNNGWDGEWFLRAYDDFGNKIGSQTCEEGKIFVEPQGFCVLANIGLKNGFAEKALSSVKSKLATKHGILLVQPAYSRYYVHLGEISSYPPGYKENGSVFCHTNPWIMIAEAIIGNGDQAHEYYLKINPSARENISDLHICEPYVYAQMIAGRDSLVFGEAKNSWLTGTAAWNFIAITQWILGVKPTYIGLEVKPVFPKNWKGFTMTRVFRGVTYHIEVKREGKGNSTRLWVNNEVILGNIIPIKKDTNDIYVKCVVK